MKEQKESKRNSYSSCFDVIGPVMVGPSSSHTAGAINIGEAAQKIFQAKPDLAIVDYYESFAETHQGHGTDFAIVSGILGFAYDDPRVPDSVSIAENEGIKIDFVENQGESPFEHPNTADIRLINDEKETRLAGISVGGGKIEIRLIALDGFEIKPQGCLPALLLISSHAQLADQFEQIIQDEQVVIVDKIQQFQADKFLTFFEIQHHFPAALLQQLAEMPGVEKLILL
ncbi:serine dehydratase beta chain [Vaginisenegalia massiliensis]|uniref:serine dehydratase beta chain n=1 Tax=Vaginisenegalia massiliensis TaxID=2058294 RepID=UPI000F51D913|nr:serine dehydratase beta chain [Vaginisenegalia massiliensis]